MDVTSSSRQLDANSARSRVQIGPAPDWVSICSFDLNYKGKIGVPVTDLLISRQIHADRRETFFHHARRLESMQAVQHESQWRLLFDPATQRVNIHWIKVHRNTESFDHANLDRIRVLQREEGLEGYVLDGWFTLLLLLEDVRPCDVIESCYTVENNPRLLPEHCSSFFALAPGTSVGSFSFSVRFNPTREMRWKSSSSELSPVERYANGETTWEWTGQNQAVAEPEVNVPEWYLGGPWAQVSDCHDWNAVASALAAAWKEDSDEATIASIAQSISSSTPDRSKQIEKAIQLVQDEHRYLSVNLDFGGQIPASPAAVVRRRYGDCKDLSFLLVRLLKLLEIEARPILVHAKLRKSVAGLLPMPGVFNHAIVEFNYMGRTRWVDATLRGQGGDALNRIVPDYGVGLPVDSGVTGLVCCPSTSKSISNYEITESLLLDTTAAPSLLAINLRLTGSHAEVMRCYLATMGMEKFAEDRLQIISNRYARARRIGQMQYRDDRVNNEFLVGEEFEVSGFLMRGQNPQACGFQIPISLVLEPLRLPEASSRKTPFNLPFPCNVAHTLEIESASLQPMAAPRFSIDSAHLHFSRRQKSLHKYWSMTLQLEILSDVVAPAEFAAHRKLIERIWSESLGVLPFPIGVGHPRKRHDFGKIPPARSETVMRNTDSRPQVQPHANKISQPLPSRSEIRSSTGSSLVADSSVNVDPEEYHGSRRRRKRLRHSRRSVGYFLVCGTLLALSVLIVICLILLKTK